MYDILYGRPNCFPSFFYRSNEFFVLSEMSCRSISAASENANAKTLL